MPPTPSSVCEKLSLKHGLLARDVVSVDGFLYSAIKRTNYTLVACDSEWVTVASYKAFSVSAKVVHLQRCLVVTLLVPQAHTLEPETFWSWVWCCNPQVSPLPTPQHHCHLSVIVRLRYAASTVCLWIPSLLLELVVCIRNAITDVCLWKPVTVSESGLLAWEILPSFCLSSSSFCEKQNETGLLFL